MPAMMFSGVVSEIPKLPLRYFAADFIWHIMTGDITGEHYWQASIWVLEFALIGIVGGIIGFVTIFETAGMIIYFLTVPVLIPLLFYWYYAIWNDAKLLSEKGGYRTVPSLWILAGLFFSPMFMSLLYIPWRHFKYGIQWSEVDWLIIR
jgi:hypothetical protein